MRNIEKVIFTNMCMICDGNGNVVMQERKNTGWDGFAFPGGHVEAGESFYDAVVREVYEETGLKLLDLRLCGLKDWYTDEGVRYVVFLYFSDSFSGTLTSSDEGKVKWVKREELLSLNLAPKMTDAIRICEEEKLCEQFFIKNGNEYESILR